MGDAVPGRWRRILIRLHLFLGVVPLAYLGAALTNTATTGFQPHRSLYPVGAYVPFQVKNFIARTWPQGRARNKIITVWGLAGPHGGVEIEENSRSIRLLQHLSEIGIRLRLVSPLAEQAKPWLPAGIKVYDDPIASLDGAHGVLLATASPEFLSIPATTIANRLQGLFFFDVTGEFDGGAVDRAGLHYMNYGPQIGPPWIDPELKVYIDHLKQKVPKDDGILLLPVLPPDSVAGRNRWFLFLNEALLPRRLYLWRTEEATATSIQFRQWALDYRELGPWQETRRWQPAQRELTGVRQTGPVRTLSAEECRAVEEHQVQWVLFFSMNADFRYQDWELLPVDVALAGKEDNS